MKRLTLLFILLFTFISLGVVAQETLKFNEDSHDFGIIQEEKGIVSFVFEFENMGETPVLIQSVKASCGCTTPSWTREPVLPGNKGTIKTAFNPHHRRGVFSKSITVTTNVGVKKLMIRGNITPRPKTLIDLYPKKMGKLRVETAYVLFNDLGKKQERMIEIKVVNDSAEDIDVEFEKLPEYLHIEGKIKLRPLEKAVWKIIYDASKTTFYGFKNDIIPILVNGERHNANSFVITATVLDDFSEMTKEQLEQAPAVQLSKSDGVFIDTQAGEIVEMLFRVKNTGQDSLFIRSVDYSSTALKVEIETKVLSKGQDAVVKVFFDTKHKKGYQNEQISLITNAPETPIVNFRISGIVFD